MNEITRRRAMQLAVGAGASAMMTIVGASALLGAETRAVGDARKVRLGFIGTGERGAALLRATRRQPGVEVPVVVDTHDCHRVLRRADIDAVVIAGPAPVSVTIDAFRAHKTVAATTPACRSLDDCRALVAAQAQHGRRFILLENHLHNPHVTAVQHLADRGLFGELTYGLGAIGPVCRWMGVDGVRDSLQTLVAMDGQGTDARRVLIRTRLGRLIELGPPGRFSLQGTRGAYDSARGPRHVYIDGRSPGGRWEPLDRYVSEVRPASNVADADDDVRMMSAFVTAVRSGHAAGELADAVTWAAVEVLSEQSARAANQPVEVPTFCSGTIV
jgi:hypothetical protein